MFLSTRTFGVFRGRSHPVSGITHYLPCLLSEKHKISQAVSPSQCLEQRYAPTCKWMSVSPGNLWRSFSTSTGLREEIHVDHRRLQSRWTRPQPTVSKAEIMRPEEAQREPDAEIKEVYSRLGLHAAASYGYLWSAVEKDKRRFLPRLSKGQRLAVLNRLIITPKGDKVWKGHEGILHTLGLTGTVTVDQLMTRVEADTRRAKPRLSNQQRHTLGWHDVQARRVSRLERFTQCCGYTLAFLIISDLVADVIQACTHDGAARKLGI